MGKPTILSNLVNRFRQPEAHGGHDPNRNESILPIASSDPVAPQNNALDSDTVPAKEGKSPLDRGRSHTQRGDTTDGSLQPPHGASANGAPSKPITDSVSPANTRAGGTQSPTINPTESTEKQKLQNKKPIPQRIKAGIFRFGSHTKHAITHSYVNIFLVFVPVGIAAHVAGLRPEIVFATNAVAVIPLASILTHATETVALNLGDTLGALLNVTFGNAVELIVFIVALVKNEIRIVQASILGSILSNLLLVISSIRCRLQGF